MLERCVGCGAEVPIIEGPIHRYMTSAPACWQRYGELLNLLYAQPDQQATLTLCVDTYAVQHPGTPNPQAIQSVGIHLLNMYAYLVQKRPITIPQQAIAERAFHAIAPPQLRSSFWLDPPSFSNSLTVFDLPLTSLRDELAMHARAWTESVWAAWHRHHAKIAEWYEKYVIRQ